MPNIRELMGVNPESIEGGEAEFDLDRMLDEVDTVLAAKHGRPAEPASPGGEAGEETPPDPSAEVTAGEEPSDGVGAVPPPVEPPEPPPVAAVAPVETDPFALMTPERRAALLELDRTLQSDESKRAEVTRVILGQPAAPPSEPPRPSLPSHIEPDSVEAEMWRDNQDLKAQIARIEQGQQQIQGTIAEQQHRTVAEKTAEAAARNFASRYPGLDPAAVMEVARIAGNTGRAGALSAAPQYQGNLQGAYEQAMEDALWTTPTLRERVGGPAAPAEPSPAVAPEATERKRKLSALSSAASPVSAPTRPSPLENRSDGRLTETSRRTVVEQAAAALRQVQGS